MDPVNRSLPSCNRVLALLPLGTSYPVNWFTSSRKQVPKTSNSSGFTADCGVLNNINSSKPNKHGCRYINKGKSINSEHTQTPCPQTAKTLGHFLNKAFHTFPIGEFVSFAIINEVVEDPYRSANRELINRLVMLNPAALFHEYRRSRHCGRLSRCEPLRFCKPVR